MGGEVGRLRFWIGDGDRLPGEVGVLRFLPSLVGAGSCRGAGGMGNWRGPAMKGCRLPLRVNQDSQLIGPRKGWDVARRMEIGRPKRVWMVKGGAEGLCDPLAGRRVLAFSETPTKVHRWVGCRKLSSTRHTPAPPKNELRAPPRERAEMSAILGGCP